MKSCGCIVAQISCSSFTNSCAERQTTVTQPVRTAQQAQQSAERALRSFLSILFWPGSEKLISGFSTTFFSGGSVLTFQIERQQP